MIFCLNVEGCNVPANRLCTEVSACGCAYTSAYLTNLFAWPTSPPHHGHLDLNEGYGVHCMGISEEKFTSWSRAGLPPYP